MKSLSVIVLTVISSLLYLSGCSYQSSISGNSWLIIVGVDTASVSDLGKAWIGIDEQSREIFTTGGDPVGAFIETYARNMMLHCELESTGMLSSPEMISLRNSWLRMKSTAAALEYFQSAAENSITESDLQFYRDHVGKTVWYTIYPGTDSAYSHGPDHLPDLDFNLVQLLDTLSVMEIASNGAGFTVRVDSVYVTDSALVAATLADTAYINAMARNRIAQGRHRRWMNSVRDNLVSEYSVVVDSAAVERFAEYYSGAGELLNETLFTSDLGDWNSYQMRDEIDFQQERMYVQPSSLAWQYHLIENLIMSAYLEDALEREEPMLMDSIISEAEHRVEETALEKLYELNVSSVVTVPESDIESMYYSLEEPLMLEEMRSIQAVVFPKDRMEEYRESVLESREYDFISGLAGFTHIAADASQPQITIPLAKNSVPGGYGEEVFSIDPSDTTGWLGPLDIFEGTEKVMFRLVEVFPEREASPEEARPYLESLIRARLENETLNLWIEELALRYNPLVNQEVRNSLPDDPGLWAQL